MNVEGREVVTYFTFQRQTIFLPFRYLYPECLFLIKDSPSLFPLRCMQDSCAKNQNCPENLAKRVLYFFQNVEPNASMMVAYFKYPDKPKRIRAGIFYDDMREPQVMTVNPSAFRKFQREGTVKQWVTTPEFSGIGGVKLPQIIDPSSLIR